MTSAEILLEIKSLPSEEQLLVLESMAQHFRSRLHAPSDQPADASSLAAAAQALLPDYQAIGDLTAFTALDGDNIHETRHIRE